MKLIFDVHLDLSLNALEWNRDLTLPLAEIRSHESDMTDLKGRGQNTVCFEEMRRGGAGLCVATQIGGCMKPPGPVASWETPAQAWGMTQGQRAYYEALCDLGEMTPITNLEQLDSHLERWADPVAVAEAKEPIGYILSLEGADSIVTIDYLERAWESGLRALGPAHYGTGRYAFGHDRIGNLSELGKEFVRKMDELGLILDVTHLSDGCFFDALEIFEGTVWASHSNCRALVNDPRQFSNEQIRLLIERGAVLGAVFDAWMMVPNWVRGESTPQSTQLKVEAIIEHIDHICQITGSAKHVGIGSDLDGGYGTEQCPSDLDSIEKLQMIVSLLEARGYEREDIEGIMHGNWIEFLNTHWSD